MTSLAAQGYFPCMDESFPARLDRLVKASGMSARKVSIKAGLNPTAVRDIVGDNILNPRTDTVRRLAEVLGLSAAELMPAPAPSSGSEPATPPAALPVKHHGPDDGIEYQGAVYIPLPVYDVRVSAGPGAMNAEHPEPEAWHLFGRDALRQVTRTPVNLLALVRVTGDSMAPTLLNGDLILVDRSVRKMGRDGMYILAWGEDIMVKRLSIDFATNLLNVTSDNPSYRSSTGVDPDELAILGRVVWISRNVGG